MAIVNKWGSWKHQLRIIIIGTNNYTVKSNEKNNYSDCIAYKLFLNVFNFSIR